MVKSSSPNLGVIRPDRCALVTDCGARANDGVDNATIDDCGGALLRKMGKHTTYYRPFEGRLESNHT